MPPPTFPSLLHDSHTLHRIIHKTETTVSDDKAGDFTVIDMRAPDSGIADNPYWVDEVPGWKVAQLESVFFQVRLAPPYRCTGWPARVSQSCLMYCLWLT